MDRQGVTKTSEGKLGAASQDLRRPGAAPHVSSHPLHQLQRALGNQACGRFIQAKLKISRPGDQYEQEADRVAEQVMRMPAPKALEGDRLVKPSAASGLQRSCTTCEEEEEQKTIHRRAADESVFDGSTLQAKGATGPTVKVATPVEAQINNLGQSGGPLPEATRAYFEPRFGHDFSGVRVHTDGAAATTARAVQARAFTAGSDIVFASGEYAPTTEAGQRLLAHELTHVVQQSRGVETQIQRTVDNVEINCADSEIHFDHDGTTTTYHLDNCDVTDNTYDAGVTLGQNTVDFDLGEVAPGTLFDFHYSIDPGQPSPNTFFVGQHRVSIVCTHVSRSGAGLGDIHFNARQLSAQEFQELTGQTLDAMPEGVMVPLTNLLNRASSVIGPAVAGASHFSPTPWMFVPRDTTGVLWTQGHTSIFANPESAFSPTIRGYRGNLANYAGEMVPFLGRRFTVRLHEGVPGSFANDAWFPLMPGEQQWVFAPRSSGEAEAFAARLRATEHGGDYTYSPPRGGPDPILGEVGGTEASLNAELRARGKAPMCTNNCITVPTAEIEAAMGGRPTTSSGVDVMTGRGPEGTIDPAHAGRGRLMTDAMGEGPLPAGASRLNIRVTPGASAGMFLIRGGGRVMLVYGIYQTEERIRGAIGTGHVATVVTEEAGAWTGGILGSALGGALAGAIVCSPTGPIDAVCVVGGFVGGLLFGAVGAALGHEGGNVVGETVVTPALEAVEQKAAEIESGLTREIYNLYGVPFF